MKEMLASLPSLEELSALKEKILSICTNRVHTGHIIMHELLACMNKDR